MMNRQHITHRLRYLRDWEFLNVFLLPACLAVVIASLELPTWLLYSYSLFLICLVLAQGALYWHLKLRTIRTATRPLPAYFHGVFTRFKRSNIIFIAGYPLLFGYALATQQTQAGEPIWATVFWLFAILEHINYYHYQLMHDTVNDMQYLLRNKRLRQSPIATDLARTAGEA
ncbi:MAG: hypothetical protein H7Y32_19910 [Chloroflexales bacterium]|nr:hypothetical protein [Chloroflexales bacterium]